MVVTALPWASLIAVTQDRMASPSRCTVQAPQAATPHPNFVPVSPRTSRRYQSTGIDGSPSNDCVWPLTCKVIMLPSQSKATSSNSRCPASRAHIGFPATAVRRDYATTEDMATENTIYSYEYSAFAQFTLDVHCGKAKYSWRYHAELAA